MKKLKYIPMVVLFCLCIGVCAVGVYSLGTSHANISGSVIITAGSADIKVDYGIEIVNAAKSIEFTLEEPERIYINSNNSASGSLIELSEDNQNVGLGNLYFSSHSEGIEDIQISITLKNNSLYPVVVNFAFGASNTIGLYSDASLKQVYLSSKSQELGHSAILEAKGDKRTFDYWLAIDDPTSDITEQFKFNLNIGFSQLQKTKIQTTIPTTPINMVDDLVINYMQTAATTSISNYISSYSTRMDVCKPFTFSYTYEGEIQTAFFELSESAAFESFKKHTLTSNSLTLQNLKVDTTYFYRLVLISSTNDAVYSTGSFVTSKTPRILNIDGAYNVRDIGGWQTSANIKQGLLFRGTEIDGKFETKYTATETGLKELKALGIVTDFDLRGSGNATPLQGVKKLYFSSPMYSAALTSTYNTRMCNMFTELAKPENYPMYIHCTYGCDRTGTICYLLEALLGVSDVELFIDYELSSLHLSGRTRNNDEFKSFLSDIAAFEGNTKQEKVTTYLFSIGITEEQIQLIKDIFLEA